MKEFLGFLVGGKKKMYMPPEPGWDTSAFDCWISKLMVMVQYRKKYWRFQFDKLISPVVTVSGKLKNNNNNALKEPLQLNLELPDYFKRKPGPKDKQHTRLLEHKTGSGFYIDWHSN